MLCVWLTHVFLVVFGNQNNKSDMRLWRRTQCVWGYMRCFVDNKKNIDYITNKFMLNILLCMFLHSVLCKNMKHAEKLWNLCDLYRWDMCVVCDRLIPDSLGEQLPEVGPKRTEAEVSWEAHKELVWPVPAVSTRAVLKLLTHQIGSSDYQWIFSIIDQTELPDVLWFQLFSLIVIWICLL